MDGSGNENKASASQDLFALDKSGWELALVTAPSTHTSRPVDNQLVIIFFLVAVFFTTLYRISESSILARRIIIICS